MVLAVNLVVEGIEGTEETKEPALVSGVLVIFEEIVGISDFVALGELMEKKPAGILVDWKVSRKVLVPVSGRSVEIVGLKGMKVFVLLEFEESVEVMEKTEFELVEFGKL